ncbi:hypothetical protein CHELA40_13824 [Chelatococcus asaccharovorans]|nr:hypothetical protein CHELA40_13824 [Chelatococcus asaccharovorans]CAH1675374.1 hypothetical protein CHELA17_61802 [Chelatococcus asaccharovorans]
MRGSLPTFASHLYRPPRANVENGRTTRLFMILLEFSDLTCARYADIARVPHVAFNSPPRS